MANDNTLLGSNENKFGVQDGRGSRRRHFIFYAVRRFEWHCVCFHLKICFKLDEKKSLWEFPKYLMSFM